MVTVHNNAFTELDGVIHDLVTKYENLSLLEHQGRNNNDLPNDIGF